MFFHRLMGIFFADGGLVTRERRWPLVDQRLKKEEEVWMSRTSSLLVAKSQECNKGEEDERKISVFVLVPPTLTLNTDHGLNSSWRS